LIPGANINIELATKTNAHKNTPNKTARVYFIYFKLKKINYQIL